MNNCIIGLASVYRDTCKAYKSCSFVLCIFFCVTGDKAISLIALNLQWNGFTYNKMRETKGLI